MGTDALATVTSNPVDDGLVYGGSSTIAFVRSFTHGASELIQQPDSRTSKGNAGHLKTDRPVSAQPLPIMERDPASYLLPPRRSANDYVQCFWEYIHPLFPVLHKTSFMEKYSHLWSAEEGRDRDGDVSDVNENIFASTLNLVFAIGCQFSASVPAQNKVALAEDFYQRSRKIFVYDIFDSTSVSLVQMLLVSGVYLQSTRYASRCWNVIGLAIRTAQSLGLHLDVAKYRPENQLNKEMARRIWHTCLVLDKSVALSPM
ncbi:uncharacterized protein A1O9_06801 [Exophiala aquamarina CBS 119918]|uniref:Xylanolytic transcriptional activator regulatory domain-containing protein n=1 Tax=Exophiala aquamarina CBS 119918 TaxID=1182545 RepID=A0A072PA26_9EURO|nr:uncharacterized protein A1O9_06801 [Exophiala aquamarina CBS 119918]KEF56612.1 hypothetical protein A1O9_06801 [Exophiala aquamarina CBS 119918]